MMDLLVRMSIRLYQPRRSASTGQTMTEYALIVAAIAIALIVTYEALGQKLSSTVSNIGNAIVAS